ncbi:hypothetical protein HK405_003457, partial [Cladochytrium tenue]
VDDGLPAAVAQKGELAAAVAAEDEDVDIISVDRNFFDLSSKLFVPGSKAEVSRDT